MVIGLEASADKTKYIIIILEQNAKRWHYVKRDNRSFERVEEFKYLVTT
jgi:hypothetical protein